MAEYIDRDKVFDAVDERIAELKADKEFNIVKEICISGVKKHISSIPPADVIPIPKGATNGDMIKAMFPNELLTSITSTLWWGDNMSFNKDWWNAPYKKESEDKE